MLYVLPECKKSERSLTDAEFHDILNEIKTRRDRRVFAAELTFVGKEDRVVSSVYKKMEASASFLGGIRVSSRLA